MTLLERLPKGRRLAPSEFESRHRAITALALVQAAGLVGFAYARGEESWHVLAEGLGIFALALAGLWPRLTQRTRSVLACTALISESAFLVHLSGGYIEAHFHFFAMLAVIALYQDYLPYLVAVGFVLAEHGIVGTLAPTLVYNHPEAIAHPWRWAAIHAGFVVAESAALLVTWKVIEDSEDRRACAQARLGVERALALKREALFRHERLSALGTLVAGVAHEVNNPLTYINWNIDIALDASSQEKPDVTEIQRALGVALTGTARIAHITSALKTVAHDHPIDARELVELTSLVENLHELARADLPHNVELQIEAAKERVPVFGNPSEIHQAVLNLVQNALQAVETTGGSVRIGCRREGDRALLDVVDTGPGVP